MLTIPESSKKFFHQSVELGDDYLYGMDGDDIVLGGSARDEVSGGAEKDMLFGGSNYDIIDGYGGSLFGIYPVVERYTLIGGSATNTIVLRKDTGLFIAGVDLSIASSPSVMRSLSIRTDIMSGRLPMIRSREHY
ncbi:calcium-binding protein [Microseira wollei]|uniref:Hemolysin-type calcium-binding region n=1 Tax=Microseira wollei NIES-4236 TaxID=2530354 RepID=A0AAV3XDS2_9CYAN|nr:calcium-binding protein [Microseira wollei]GET41072.1 hemolysin-type calcium-binding region [Microseira wollei NIES-4236]